MSAFSNPALYKTAALLVCSNIFMTFAWYGHLRRHESAPLWSVVLVSWGIAFFEYLIMVPANRIGHAGGLDLAQLKIMQEVITLTVFMPFSLLIMKEPFRWDFVWAALCMFGAVYFIFRTH